MRNGRRKLRVLVISMGGPRQEAIDAMFAEYSDYFEPPTFCPGIPARSIRVRSEFYRIAHTVGLIPDVEWDALQEGFQNALYQEHPNRFFECLQNVPITTIGRLGSTSDLEVHYSVELWRKSKGLNRGRSVLACMLAHLLAMKRLVEEGFDLILEDNVRLCYDSAQRIWDTMDASESEECHLRYYGWLGSLPNLEWVLDVHSERSGLAAAPDKAFYFPIPKDFDDLVDLHETGNSRSTTIPVTASSSCPKPTAHQTPGGTPIWGAYSYWISRVGYDALLRRLRCDVGAMLWKGKRMRAYVVKPIDKVLPRHVIAALGRTHVHVTRQPAFFRAPMLTSKIHAQWDPEFCKSTQYQLSRTNLTWNDLWLTTLELKIVQHNEACGEWLTTSQIEDGTTSAESPEQIRT
jgi:hypothetical protein